MSTRTVNICEECGKQTANPETWLVTTGLDVILVGTGESVVHLDSELDFCSPGCLLRYFSRSLENAQGCYLIHKKREVREIAAAI